jgi:HEAT repeat protein
VWHLSAFPRSLRAAIADSVHPKRQVRRSAAADVGRHLAVAGEARAELLEALGKLLGDSAVEVRIAAALAAADAKATELSGQLCELLGAPEEAVAQHALIALGEVGQGDGEGRRQVAAHLADPRSAMRFQAVLAMRQLAGEAALPQLLERFDDDDAHVRHVALRCWEDLTMSPDGPAVREPQQGEIAALHQRLQDGSAQVRALAAILLGRLGEPTA